ncbi:SusC/RagA family TonB-linked outer membrane protein [Bacteroidales bacterium]|nr:SusC/RagA family TonB-linked outer membrane protein [Bacteroidales bacterium]
MKNISERDKYALLKKTKPIFRLMKLAFLMLFLFITGSFANEAASQEAKVSIEAKASTFKEILSNIENQTEYLFVYNQTEIDLGKKMTISASNKTLAEVLNTIFQNTDIDYALEGKNIILMKKKDSNEIQQDVSQGKNDPKITGVISDDNGEPVIGASVVVKGTKIGTVTDIDGRFSIEAPSDSRLVISYLGYNNQELAIAGKSVLNIRLSEDTQALDEVVVIGYGTQKKVNLTGSISTIDAKALANRPITNSTQALQGIQGLYVNQAGGQPGKDAATIRIRGQGTLNNNDPLVLVDGIEFPLDAVNPNDIESVSVLKDAASSAIYGSRAANGVILVTTKSGKKGGFVAEYNNYFGTQKPTYLPDMVYDPIVFMEKRNEAQRNEGRLTVDYPQSLINEYQLGITQDPYTYPRNNWLDIMYKDAFMMEHNLRFSGGDEKYTYSLSLGYNDQKGVLRGTDASKTSLAFNASAKINSRLTIGSNLSINYNVFNEPAAGIYNLVEMTYKAQAFHPTYLSDGRYANTFIRTPGHNVYRHPLALADEGQNESKKQHILANLSAEYKLPYNLNYRLSVGLNKYDYVNSLFIPTVFEYQVKTMEELRIDFAGNPRKARKTDENNLNATVFSTLGWEHKLNENHSIKALGGVSYENFYDSNFYSQREGFLGNTLTELDAGSTNAVVGGTSKRSILMSTFGRVNYDFRDKYLLEANFRYDGSSRFAKGNRWGIFPSFSAGWRIGEESSVKEIDWMQNLKLRASWGQLGNERISLFRYVDLIQLGQNYPFNGNMTPGAAVTAYSDPDITWETTTMTNIGLDLALFKGALELSAELFYKRTSDILRPVSLPDQVGSLEGPIRNIGTVDNKGLEIGLSYRNNISDFHYGITGNMTFLKNEIVDLKGQTIIDGMFILQEGQAIDSYYMLHAEGIFQSQEEIDNSPFQSANTKPGYIKFADTNQDGKITEDDRQIVGGVIPSFTYTFGLNMSYKNFDLHAFFQGVTNVSTYSDRIAAIPFWFGCGLPTEWLTEAWTPERGSSATLPILTTYEGSQNENFRLNDFWLRDASYLRMKNIQLTYNVPVSFLKRKVPVIKALRVFVNGANLLTFSPMNQFDPEKDVKSSTWYEYPSLKSYTTGINLTF